MTASPSVANAGVYGNAEGPTIGAGPVQVAQSLNAAKCLPHH